MTIVDNDHPSLIGSSSYCIGKTVAIITDRLYFATVDQPTSKCFTGQPVTIFVYQDAHYESFYNDFGPYNLSVLYRFCQKLIPLMRQTTKRKPVVFCSPIDSQSRVNCAFLVGAYAIIYHGLSADDAYKRLADSQPPKFIAFRDAAMGQCSWYLCLRDTLASVQTAMRLKWFDFDSFDPDEYEHYERVENGDFNWILPGKILAFCGPHQKSVIENGYPYHAPDVYFDYFRTHNITTIVRLNKKVYDAAKFHKAGFDHIDLFFVDGSTPSDDIMLKFIQITDDARGGLAVHCKAGLGRTGTLIGCWMMKEYGVTAAECIAWMRICRPGCVIGPQQQFMIDKQEFCWKLGGWHFENGCMVRTRDNGKKQMSQSNLHSEHLPTRLDSIKLNKSNQLSRPNQLNTTSRTDDNSKFNETRENNGVPVSDTDDKDADPGQGDRLLLAKAARQHEHDRQNNVRKAIFTSPTTPMKMVRQSIASQQSTSSLGRNGAARNLNFDEQPTKLARVAMKNSYATRVRLPTMLAGKKDGSPKANPNSKTNNSSSSNSSITRNSSHLRSTPVAASPSSSIAQQHTQSMALLRRAVHPYASPGDLVMRSTKPALHKRASPKLDDTVRLGRTLPQGARVYALRPRISTSTLTSTTRSASHLVTKPVLHHPHHRSTNKFQTIDKNK